VAKVDLVYLDGQDTARPGETVTFALTSTNEVGLRYQVASSFGTGPMPVDHRTIDLTPDPLLYLSTWNAIPGLFLNYAGVFSPRGMSVAKINVPDSPLLIGLKIYSAFVTLDQASPPGVVSISNTSSFTIGK
jgi:hypothetical protein